MSLTTVTLILARTCTFLQEAKHLRLVSTHKTIIEEKPPNHFTAVTGKLNME